MPLGDLWAEPTVKAAFGRLPHEGSPPKSMCVISGIRGAKSTLAAAKVYASSQNVDLSGVRAGDEVRIPVLSTNKDSAKATFTHICGAIVASPILRKSLIGEPKIDSLWLRHPTGFAIEVKVTALSRYGSSVISRWFAGIVFDEAPRMGAEGDFVLNLHEARRAAAGRILPNGQEWLVGSPYVPEGPVYDLVAEHEGKPSAGVCVVRAPGPAMNPYYWTEERCEDLRVRDPVAHRTDVLAKFMRHPDSLYDPDSIAACTGRPSKPKAKLAFEAYLNPGERSAHWSLLVATCTGMGGPQGVSPMLEVVKAATISTGSVAKRVHWLAEQLKPYRIELVNSVCEVSELASDLAEGYGLIVAPIDVPDRLRSAERLSAPFDHKTIRIPDSRILRKELVGARRRVTPMSHSLYLPTAEGRAGDFVPAMALLAEYPPEPPETDEELEDAMMRRHLEHLRADEDEPVSMAARRLA